MLYLLFELDGDRFAIDTAKVRGVLPLIDITRVPQTPVGVVGVCDCRGAAVPVVDLSQVLLGRPAERRLSTRILIVAYVDGRGRRQRLGLIAERATQLLRRDDAAWVASGVRTPNAPYLGEVAGDASGLIQRLDIDAVLPDAVRDCLFGGAAH